MYSEFRSRQALFLALFLILATASCSVKEDREECPCALHIKLENLPLHPVKVIVEGISGREEFLAYGDTVVLARPPKGVISIKAVAGATVNPDGKVEIPYGFDSPPVYLFTREMDLTGKDADSLNVLLHKHFCELSLVFSGPPGWGEPYWAEVKGPVDGILWDGTPTDGRFSCRLDDGLSIRLPRQSPDQPLLLNITMPDRIVRTFDLGYCLELAGYDWDRSDLEDRTLEINLSVTALTLRIDSWSTVIPLEIIV
jgi:hypothetical protein